MEEGAPVDGKKALMKGMVVESPCNKEDALTDPLCFSFCEAPFFVQSAVETPEQSPKQSQFSLSACSVFFFLVSCSDAATSTDDCR